MCILSTDYHWCWCWYWYWYYCWYWILSPVIRSYVHLVDWLSWLTSRHIILLEQSKLCSTFFCFFSICCRVKMIRYKVVHYYTVHFSLPILTVCLCMFYVISYHIMSYHVISYHIMSHHVISYHSAAPATAATGSTGFGLPAAAPTAADATPVLGTVACVCVSVCVCIGVCVCMCALVCTWVSLCCWLCWYFRVVCLFRVSSFHSFILFLSIVLEFYWRVRYITLYYITLHSIHQVSCLVLSLKHPNLVLWYQCHDLTISWSSLWLWKFPHYH